MPNKKNIFVLLFLIPLLWAISALSYSIDLNPLKKTDSSVFIQKQNNTYNTFQTAPVNARKTINVLDETEPEFEIEFDLFYDDFMLPTGNLREYRNGCNRANAIIVTKCPENLSQQNQNEIEVKINKYLNTLAILSFSTSKKNIPDLFIKAITIFI